MISFSLRIDDPKKTLSEIAPQDLSLFLNPHHSLAFQIFDSLLACPALLQIASSTQNGYSAVFPPENIISCFKNKKICLNKFSRVKDIFELTNESNNFLFIQLKSFKSFLTQNGFGDRDDPKINLFFYINTNHSFTSLMTNELFYLNCIPVINKFIKQIEICVQNTDQQEFFLDDEIIEIEEIFIETDQNIIINCVSVYNNNYVINSNKLIRYNLEIIGHGKIKKIIILNIY